MRERRIDRIRLCRTGSDERNLSALLMTNAGSSLNRTFGSMREILSDRSIVRNASNCEARKLGASHGQSGVIGSSVVLVPTFPGTYPHDAQPDYFRIAQKLPAKSCLHLGSRVSAGIKQFGRYFSTLL